MSGPVCPCDSDGCPREHQNSSVPTVPLDFYDAPEAWEAGEPEAATEETIAHLGAGEAGRWGESC